jgi:hypothetical protein
VRGLKVNRSIPAFPAAAAQPRVELEWPVGAAPFDLEVSVCSHEMLMVAPKRWELEDLRNLRTTY